MVFLLNEERFRTPESSTSQGRLGGGFQPFFMVHSRCCEDEATMDEHFLFEALGSDFQSTKEFLGKFAQRNGWEFPTSFTGMLTQMLRER